MVERRGANLNLQFHVASYLPCSATWGVKQRTIFLEIVLQPKSTLVVVGVGIANAFGSGLMTIEPGPAAPPAADADCGTLPPKPQPAAAAADPNAMKENEEAGANLLL